MNTCPHVTRISSPERIAGRPGRLLFAALLLITIAGCASVTRAPADASPVVVTPPPAPAEVIQVLETKTGLASYYHPSLDGGLTASGVPFDNAAMMAAHPTYPFGTVVRVTNLEKSEAVVEVHITDRGPTDVNVAEGVIIDLSGAAAAKLGMLEDGRVRVKVEVLEWGMDARSQQSTDRTVGSWLQAAMPVSV